MIKAKEIRLLVQLIILAKMSESLYKSLTNINNPTP